MTTMYTVYELRSRISALEVKVAELETLIKNLLVLNTHTAVKDQYAPPYTVTCGVQNEVLANK